MFTTPTLSPNVLDGKTLMVKMRVGAAWETCAIRRVYYEDTKRTREIFVDAECRGKMLVHTPLSTIHRYSTAGVVAYMFQQEERDQMLSHDKVQQYACHVSFRLQQGRLHQALVWHGVAVLSRPPSAGVIYMRGHILLSLPHIIIHPHVPVALVVRDHNKTVSLVKVVIDSVDDRAARVTLKGDTNIIHTSVLIDDLVYSGKDKFNTYLKVLDTW